MLHHDPQAIRSGDFFVVGGAGLAHGPACRSGRRASQFSRKKSNKKAVLPKQNCQVCDTG